MDSLKSRLNIKIISLNEELKKHKSTSKLLYNLDERTIKAKIEVLEELRGIKWLLTDILF